MIVCMLVVLIGSRANWQPSDKVEKETLMWYRHVQQPRGFVNTIVQLCTEGTRQDKRIEVTEMRMLRWMCGVTRKDKIRNEHIRWTTRVAQASKKITERRLIWYGHVMRNMMGKARGKVSKGKGRDAKADSERSGRTTMRNNGQRNLYQRLRHWPTTVKGGQDWWIANRKDAPTWLNPEFADQGKEARKLGLFKLQLTLKKHYLNCWIQVALRELMKWVKLPTAVIDRVTLETVSFTGKLSLGCALIRTPVMTFVGITNYVSERTVRLNCRYGISIILYASTTVGHPPWLNVAPLLHEGAEREPQTVEDRKVVRHSWPVRVVLDVPLERTEGQFNGNVAFLTKIEIWFQFNHTNECDTCCFNYLKWVLSSVMSFPITN